MITIDQNKFGAAYAGRQQRTCGVTLVAFLGKGKPRPFVDVVELAQQTIQSELARRKLASYFEAYPMPQIHATLVGLEGLRRGTTAIINDNLSARLAGLIGRAAVPPMDAGGLLEFFRKGYSSFDIQIGGFSEDDWNPFDPASRPYERTFDIQSNGLFVMMGWPVSPAASGLAFLPLLCGIRKHLERFNVVHKYHIVPADEDNDLFFAIGSLNYPRWRKATAGTKENLKKLLDDVRTEIRNKLSVGSSAPYRIPVDVGQLRVVKYARTTLQQITFSKVVAQVTVRELVSHY